MGCTHALLFLSVIKYTVILCPKDCADEYLLLNPFNQWCTYSGAWYSLCPTKHSFASTAQYTALHGMYISSCLFKPLLSCQDTKCCLLPRMHQKQSQKAYNCISHNPSAINSMECRCMLFRNQSAFFSNQ